jgi:hypothetical protein
MFVQHLKLNGFAASTASSTEIFRNSTLQENISRMFLVLKLNGRICVLPARKVP